MHADIEILNKQPATEHHAELFELHPEGSILCGRHMVLRLKNDIDATTGHSTPYFYLFGGACENRQLPINSVIDLGDKTGLRITPLRCIYRAGKLHHVKLFIELIKNPALDWLLHAGA